MSQAQIAVMPDRGSVFDPVFFSGDLETGEVLALPVLIGMGWTFFSSSLLEWKALGYDAFAYLDEKRWKLGSSNRHFCWTGVDDLRSK